MTPDYNSQIGRLEKEIAGLDKDEANLAKKEAELVGKINRTQDAVNRAKSASQVKSKLRELERVGKGLAGIKSKQSHLSRKRAQKNKNLIDYKARQSRGEEKTRMKAADDERKLMREREAHQRRMSIATLRQGSLMTPDAIESISDKTYDFFICHASEDKDEIVQELAEILRGKGAKVWYDTFELRVGSRLRREIERGLVSSRYGIVVASSHFFAKDWPQRELDGLFSLDTQEQSNILPIWHKVTKDEVAKHSPILAGIVALNTGVQSVEDIATELMKLIQ